MIFPLSNHAMLRASSSGRSASVLMNDVLEAASCRGTLEGSTKHEFDEQLCCAINVIFAFFLLVKCLMLDWKDVSLQSNSMECSLVRIHMFSLLVKNKGLLLDHPHCLQ